MRPCRARRWWRSAVATPLFTLALTAMLLSAASVPHHHIGPEQGFYNLDHDLTYLATSGGGGPVSAIATLSVGVVVLSGVATAVTRVTSEPRRHTDSRAPPVR